MINIRYHIVSITAVFLALGIGVALGGTFLSKATVRVLDNNITSAEKRIKETNAENDRLNRQVTDSKERDASLIAVGSESLVADELTDIPVLVVAAPGVDNDAIDAASTILERTGADFRGTLQLSDKLAFNGDVDADLAKDLGITSPGQPQLRTASTTSLTAALMAAGMPLTADGTSAGESDATTTTTTVDGAGEPPCCTAEPPVGDQPRIATILLDHGYLDLEPGPGYTNDDPILESVGYRYVFLGGPDLDEAQNQILLSLLPDAGAAMPATVMSASQAAPVAEEVLIPTVVAQVRESDELRPRYNTVDDSETFAGQVAMVFTLRDMGVADPGQYGQADGATAVLPPAS
jgi:hypothetical protein